jgi:hypothetical protein
MNDKTVGETREYGLLFNTEMMVANLGGDKCVTRRLTRLGEVNERPNDWPDMSDKKDVTWGFRSGLFAVIGGIPADD